MRTILVLLVASLAAVARAEPDSLLHIDASDLPRRLLHATQSIDVPQAARERGELVLRYPHWVPGTHAPGGPIQNLAGLWFTDQGGRELDWRRQPGDVYQFRVELPPGVERVTATMRYITNQPDANSRGIDSFGAADVGLVSPNTVLLYPARAGDADFSVRLRLSLPEGWHAATALRRVPADTPGITYDTASLREVVDSPIMVGRHLRSYSLNEPGVDAPPHRLHVFSESASAVEIDDHVLGNYRAMVTQAGRLFQSFPFRSMDVLLMTTDQLGRNGLEHLESTMNIIPLGTLDGPGELRGWDRMLIPHEYVHAWCGKHRRPRGMATGDLHTPKGTELLWVYEGLTQYLGEVLEVRSGMETPQEYLWSLRGSMRSARLRQGRDWRPLLDTCSASHTLRAGSRTWGDLRRSQDYYAEGALIWMEADAIIRRGTGGQRSLDDFVARFFHAEEPTGRPVPFDRDDLLDALGEVHEHDWRGFFEHAIDRTGGDGPMSAAQAVGYDVVYQDTPPWSPFGRASTLDARESLGASFDSGGRVRSVLLDTPADWAGLAPDVRVIAVDGYLWSSRRLRDAIEASEASGSVALTIAVDDRLREVVVEYGGGPRYFNLVRDEGEPDVLADILEPR